MISVTLQLYVKRSALSSFLCPVVYLFIGYLVGLFEGLHLHQGRLADTFVQSNLQLQERTFVTRKKPHHITNNKVRMKQLTQCCLFTA